MERPSMIKCNNCGSQRDLRYYSSVMCKTCSSYDVKTLKSVPVAPEDVEDYSSVQAKHAEIRRLNDEIWAQHVAYEANAKKQKYLGLAKLIEVACTDDIEFFTSEYERYFSKELRFDSRLSCIDNLKANSNLAI